MTDIGFLQNLYLKVKPRKRAILVVGPQNSAKSTLIALFLKKKLKAETDEQYEEIRLNHVIEGE